MGSVDSPVFVPLDGEVFGVKFVSLIHLSHLTGFYKVIFSSYKTVLSDPSSVCSNTTTNSPYDPLVSQDPPATVDESNCNSCVCTNGKPRCSNLWCGLNNCLNRSHSGNACESHQVCVPAAQESCLSPPCTPRGDCRTFEPSRRVAPPRIPAPIDCWPNQVGSS